MAKVSGRTLKLLTFRAAETAYQKLQCHNAIGYSPSSCAVVENKVSTVDHLAQCSKQETVYSFLSPFLYFDRK